MANIIKVKRSAVPASAPTTANLALGELAINTYDGKLFLRKDNGTASIIEVGAGGGVGSIAYTEYNFTATAAQTTFAVGVAMPLADVYLNGVRQLPTTDYTVSGTNIILTTGAPVGAIVAVLVFVNSAVAGTVSSVSVANANGVSGTVTNPTTTPELTLSISTSGAGSIYATNNTPTITDAILINPTLGTPASGLMTNVTGTAAGLTAGHVTTNANLTGGVTSVGNAATVVTNANLTGVITSSGNATSIASQTGTGTTFVVDTAPLLNAPTYSTDAAFTAGTNAQGQGPITTDIVVITTAAANPSGVTLPVPTVGRRIIIVNKSATSQINVYPSSGCFIDSLSVNTSLLINNINAGHVSEFIAYSTTSWQSSNYYSVNPAAITSTILASKGGTGQSTYAVGDILYASAGSSLSKLTAGTLNYVLTSGGPGVAPSWAVGGGGGGGSPGGSTGQMQYNNAGAFAGAVNVTVNNNDLTLLENNTPVTPPASTCKVFSKNVANRQFLAFVGPSGLDTSVQPLLGRNKIAWYVPIMGGSSVTANGISLTGTGTATGATWANTNIVTSTSRLNFRAVTSTSSVCGIRGSVLQYWRGNAAGLGGFTFISRFSIGQAATTPTTTTLRCFVGLRNTTSAPTDLSPAGFINSIGAGWESGSTTLQIYCAGTVMSQVNTTVPLVRTVETSLYDVAIFCPPNETTVSVMVTNVGTGATQTALFDAVATPTLVPVNTLGLCPNSFMSAGGTNTTMGFNIHSLYIETDN